MEPIIDTAALAAFCDRQAASGYIAIDTEFLRETTYWPKLCLVQIAGPDEAAVIDPLAPDIDLAPLFALMDDERVLKVFHSARQDVEIFVHLTGRVPRPLFDTQVVAMVCGFGESVGYDTLVSKLTGARIDKSSRFTDWSRRPLTERQLQYALADVVHLRPVYEALRARLDRSGRADWLAEEMALLADPATYLVDPAEAWRRIKTRSTHPRFLAALRELAAWRESEAQRRDMPRGRLLRDDMLLEIASHAPKAVEDLARTRGLGRAFAEGWQGKAVIAAIERSQALPDAELPRVGERTDLPQGLGPVVELLRVLLKARCDETGVAQKLVASGGDLELLAAGDAGVPALHGWRHELFGRHAQALRRGEIALGVKGKRIRVVPLDGRAGPSTAPEPASDAQEAGPADSPDHASASGPAEATVAAS